MDRRITSHTLRSATNERQVRQHRTKYRGRNILTLEDRVAVIHEYEQRPVYTRLADKYGCSAKQIKNIIENKEAVLLCHANRMANGYSSDQLRERQQKIAFLGRVIYEFVQRAVHYGVELDTAMVRNKALEVKESMAIQNFYPNNAWMQNFKTHYRLDELNLMALRRCLVLAEVKEQSLEAIDLVDYVRRLDERREHKRREQQQEQQQQQQQQELQSPPPLQRMAFKEEPSCETHSQWCSSDEPTNAFESSCGESAGHEIPGTVGPAVVPAVVSLDCDVENHVSKDEPLNLRRRDSRSPSLRDISSYEEALCHLKLLEVYAMLNQNFRSIGLITQLQQTLKDPPESKEFLTDAAKHY